MLNDMLYADNVNTNDSSVKRAIDKWYEIFLKGNQKFLEDVIYCNDRRLVNDLMFKPTGGSVQNEYTYFYEGKNHGDLSCSATTDKFSVSNSKAKLKYPIGLATSPEMNILNNATVRAKGYWLGSPYDFHGYFARVRDVFYDGYLSSGSVDGNVGVRPAVSLISGTEYVSGDGSTDNPYIVE
jgi:hypothetical protein